jgi:cbb3-type cytochrome oxidase subunit 3
MTYIYMFWIVLLLLVVIGTVLSTFLYARYRKSNRAQGNRLNTLDSMLFQH